MTRSSPKKSSLAAALLAATALVAAHAETRLERGTYLTESIVACGNCHTPQGPDGPLPGKTLAGGMDFTEGMFTAYAANITPDKATGIGRWTDAQIITAIREGKRPNGTIIGPPMPIGRYRGISDSDAKAIVAYLRSVPAVENKVPKSVYRMPLPPAYGPPVGKVAGVPQSDKVAYGRYLAGPAGHCIECHSPPGVDGAPDLEKRLGSGGMAFPGPWGMSLSANITPTGLQRYSDAEIKTIITTGVRPDGSKLKPPMAVPYYAKLTPADQDALVAYLSTLPRK
jgi:mono/diheme cytochrome c family protein